MILVSKKYTGNLRGREHDVFNSFSSDSEKNIDIEYSKTNGAKQKQPMILSFLHYFSNFSVSLKLYQNVNI